mgnify:CR=1 FL=1
MPKMKTRRAVAKRISVTASGKVKIKKANLLVSSVEVWNPSPINPDRDEESEINIKKPLRFGSRTNITTAGNWE